MEIIPQGDISESNMFVCLFERKSMKDFTNFDALPQNQLFLTNRNIESILQFFATPELCPK